VIAATHAICMRPLPASSFAKICITGWPWSNPCSPAQRTEGRPAAAGTKLYREIRRAVWQNGSRPTPRAPNAARRHGWPGNVRTGECNRPRMHDGDGDTVDVCDLPEYLWDSGDRAADIPNAPLTWRIARRSRARLIAQLWKPRAGINRRRRACCASDATHCGI